MATILIVDDRPSNRQFLTTLLGYGGHRMLEAENGEGALESVRADRPDLVITDILMPKMDGYEFVQRLRADPAVSGTPVIFYTATYSSPQAEALAKSCGVRMVLPKPCEPQVMLAAVNRELGVLGEGNPVGGGDQPGAAMRAPDETMTLFLKDLEDVKQRFEDLAAQSPKLQVRRDAVNELSRKFADNISSMQRVSTRLSALLEVGMELMSERDPRRLVELFFAATCDLIDAKYAAVGMLDGSERAIGIAFAKGFDAGMLHGAAGLEGLLGSILSGQRKMRTRALPGASGAEGLPAGHPRTRNLLGVPVASADHVYGWMYFADKRGKEGFTEEDTRLLNAMTRKLALLFENAMLYDAVQRNSAELQIEVSNRRRAQEALRERDAGLHRAQVIAKLAHVISTPDGSFESWSDTLPQMLGVQADAMPRSTREWLNLVHPEEREIFRTRSIEAGKTGARFECEYRLKSGEHSWIRIRQVSEPVDALGDTPNRRRWFGTLQDVTEQKLAEEEQRAVKQLLDNIVDNIPTAVQLKSVQDDFRILLWNKAAETMYGVPRQDAIGRNVHDLWPGGSADAMHAADLELVASRRMQDFPDRPAQTRHRGVIPAHMRKVALSDATGKVTHLLVIADDITERKLAAKALAESEERLALFVEHAPAAIAMLDKNMRYVAVSRRWLTDYRVGEKGLHEVVGRSHYDVFPEIPERWKEIHRRCMAGAVEKCDEDPFPRADGKIDWVRWEIRPWRKLGGEIGGILLFSELVTERKEAADRITRLNRVYAVLSGINALIVRASDRDELFRESCRIAVEEGGFGMAWIGEFDPATLDVTPVAWHGMDESAVSNKATARDDIPAGLGMVGRAIRGKVPVITNDIHADPGAGGPRRAEALRKGFQSIIAMPLLVDGEVRATLTLFARELNFFSDDELKLLTELAGDISFAMDHIEKAEKLNYLAYYDSLTGLANRTLFQERLSQYLQSAEQVKGKLALALVDVERFKTINDSLGRQAGDALLNELANRLGNAAQPANIARTGSDHFAIVLPGVRGRSEVVRTIEQIWRDCFAQPFRVSDTELRVSAKAGIALYPSDGANAESLFAGAEAALQKAQQTGERYQFHTPELTAGIADQLALENRLRQALEKNEFVLHYQPKVDLQARRIVGVEALIRWQSPELGLVPPLKFIPLMEETGLILDVGAWALSRAIADHARWLELGVPVPRIAVNVSAIQLRRRDFVATVEQALKGGATPPGIDLEITESLMMEDVEASIRKLKELRALGLSIAIDDFGTGYSSLAYLAKLPLATLKIDRAFIVTMLDDPDTATLVQMMITLAHSLKLKVVAEGVEKEEQAKILRLLRCDQMQGYLYSKPLPFADITAMLEATRT